jgi:hypothetical protein
MYGGELSYHISLLNNFNLTLTDRVHQVAV